MDGKCKYCGGITHSVILDKKKPPIHAVYCIDCGRLYAETKNT